MTPASEDPAPIMASPPDHPTTKPFRFKKHRPRSSSCRDRSGSPSRSDHHPHHRHHRHHHRSRRRSHIPPDDPTINGHTYLPHYTSDQYVPPDIAFRESLFDALADDEGAAYWEGVYGQPIHTYSPYTAKADADTGDDADNPKLERMTDEEYVSYVRSKMWEKSHGYIIEERKRREEERKRKRERDERSEEEGRRWQAGLEDALQRGQERRKAKRWKGAWERYVRGWERASMDPGHESRSFEARIFWPVESGELVDVSRDKIEAFFRHAPKAATEGGHVELDVRETLKKERVRWHPDRMQQRAGSKGLGDETLKLVTAVFQIVDRLWSEAKTPN